MPFSRYTIREIIKRPLFFPLCLLILLILLNDHFSFFPLTTNLNPDLLYKNKTYDGYLLESPKVKEGKIKYKIALSKVLNPLPQTMKGKVLLTALGEGSNFHRGDLVRFSTQLKVPRSYQNPGGFDYARFLKRQGISATGFVKSQKQITLVKQKSQSRWQHAVGGIKQKIKGDVLTKDEGGILVALLWGDKSHLTKQTNDLFRTQGINHLLVISGLHFAIFSFLVFQFFIFIARRFPKAMLYLNVRKLAALGTLGILTLYFFFCEVTPSITRAYIVIVCFLIALLLNRSRDWLNILFLAALIILLTKPSSLFSLSFQFSFVAVLSILLLFPLLRDKLNKNSRFAVSPPKSSFLNRVAIGFRNRFLDLLILNFSILIGLTPLLIFHFHRLQTTSFLMNLWAVPYFELFIVPLAVTGLFFQLIYPPIALFIFSIDLKLISGAVWILEKAHSFFPQNIFVFPPRVWELLAYYLFVLVLILKIQPKLKKGIVAVLILIGLVNLTWNIYSINFDKNFKITHLDVGQGDSILVELPRSKRILVDGGGSPFFDIGENVLIPFLLHQRIPSLDAVVVTHSDYDHYGGLLSLIKNYSVKELWWSGIKGSSLTYKKLFKIAESQGIKIVKLEAGMAFSLGGMDQINVLAPDNLGTKDKRDNNQSIVLRFASKRRVALLTGDIEQEVERRLVYNNNPLLKADYLKVAHHGSKTSSIKTFLEKVSPKVATVGVKYRNRFDHPDPDIVSRFNNLRIPSYRTDYHGAIEVNLDEKGLKVKTFVAKHLSDTRDQTSDFKSSQIEHFP